MQGSGLAGRRMLCVPSSPPSCKPGDEAILKLFDLRAGVHTPDTHGCLVLRPDPDHVFEIRVRLGLGSLHVSTSP